MNEARLLYRRGRSFEAISRELCINATTIASWCRRMSRRMESSGWGPELIVESFQAFSREEGRSPTTEDLKRDKRLPAMKTLYRYFPSMDDALRAAGLPTCGRRSWSPGGVLDTFLEFKDRTGRWPQVADIRDTSSGLPGFSTIKRYFETTSLVKLARLAEARYAEVDSSSSKAMPSIALA